MRRFLGWQLVTYFAGVSLGQLAQARRVDIWYA